MDLHSLFVEPLQYQFMQRALIASTMVGVICGVLGCYIILRRMALIGDALAHAVLPGVVIGFIVAGKGPLPIFIGAVVAGLVTALLIGFVHRSTRTKEDTAIGVIFTGAFALGILLISGMKSVHLDLQHFLFGDPLGVAEADLWLTGIVGVVILISIFLFYKQLLVTSFDPVLAMAMGVSTGLVHYLLMGMLSMTVVASLQAVGIILVVAMLITPGATAYLLTDRLPRMLLLAAIFGVVAAVVGLYISYWMNYSSGSAMVLVATLLFLLTMLLAPEQGLIVRTMRRMRAARKHMEEDFIKAIHRFRERGESGRAGELATALGVSMSRVRSLAGTLVRRGLVTRHGPEEMELTPEGAAAALRLIRSHRLWESYLSRQAGVEWQHLDPEAEELEHLLPDDLVDEIDADLGFPARDPHGAPIPTRSGQLQRPADRLLSDLQPGDTAVITRVSDQMPDVLQELSSKGLGPGVRLGVRRKENGTMILKVGHQEVSLEDKVTRRVLVAEQGKEPKPSKGKR